MNYISLLNDEDVLALCNIISGKTFKLFFQNNQEELSQIKPGFRPNGISENDAVSLAVSNIEKPFISSYVNNRISEWLEEIQIRIDKLRSMRLSVEHAEAEALADSVFRDDVELYFKLIKKNIDISNLGRIKSYTWGSKNEKTVNDEGYFKNNTAIAKEPKTKKDQPAECIEKMKDTESTCSDEIEVMRINQGRLEKLLDDANKKIQKLQDEKQDAEKELKDLQARVAYDDKEESSEAIAGSEGDYDHVSICEVAPVDFKGRHSIVRLADIDKKGNIEVFYANEELPKTFENRNKLFYKQGPTEEGTLGVWNWSSKPNIADPSRDYVTSSFNPVISPIEVVFVPDCKSGDDLLEKIKKGIETELNMSRVLFVAYLAKNHYLGFLCRSRGLEQKGSFVKLSSEVVSLPEYSISNKDIVRLSNNTAFYRSISIGIPDEVVNVKDRLDIVRSIILSRNSWNVFKQKGKTRSEWKNMRELLDGMDTVSITEDIIKMTRCTPAEAQKMLDDFTERAGDYINGTSIEDNIIAAVVSSNFELMERCKSILREDWIKENEAAVSESKKILDDLQMQINHSKSELEKELAKGKDLIAKQKLAAKGELDAIRTEHNILQESLHNIESEIGIKKKLVAEVDSAVHRKMQQAQNDAAEFIASLVFSSQFSSKKDETTNNVNSIRYFSGSDMKYDELENNCSWEETIDTLSYELIDAGVNPDYARPLAAYMYAAFLNHNALLMIGPNSSSIVDAFSAGIFGRTAGVLEFTENYNVESVEECYSSNDRIVKIVNPFSCNWVTHIPDIIGGDKYFIAVYPYSEDIQIEPKSIYSYMLPVFTEVFIDRLPTGKSMGGKKSENYKDFQMVKAAKVHNRIFVKMHTSNFVRIQIQTLLTNMHKMLNDQNMDYDVLFALFPYAFATMQMPLLLDALKDSDSYKISVSKSLLELINEMYGED